MEIRQKLASSDIRILCVDDERNVLKALRRMFIDDEWEILTAESAAEGLEILEQEEEIQLVISDFRMPGMNGVDFLGQVRKRWPDTIRIVLSGYADAACIVAAINEGEIYKFIPKPWNDDELKVTLHAALEHYFLQKENHELLEKLQKSNAELKELNDNLEHMVEKRTEELMMRNQALQISQTILDALPIGVVGLDIDGVIVRTNRAAMSLMGLEDEFVFGNSYLETLPRQVSALIESFHDEICRHGDVLLGDRELRFWLTRLRSGEQEGIVLGRADLSGNCPCRGDEKDDLGERLCLMSQN